jgi:hypothetical protein
MKIKVVGSIVVLISSALLLSACGDDPQVDQVTEAISSISSVSLGDEEQISKIGNEYNALSDQQKRKVENADKLKEAQSRIEDLKAAEKKKQELYKNLSEEIETANSLKENYFSRYYDMNNLNTLISDAQNALDVSDVNKYEDILDNLKAEVGNLQKFVDDEQSKIYNEPVDPESQYPFAVTDISDDWYFEPVIMQSSKFPVEVDSTPPQTTDGKPFAYFGISSPDDAGSVTSTYYNYTIKQIDTKEVQVKIENDEMKTALVNTEMDAQVYDEIATDEYTALNERPAYFIRRGGATELLLQSYDGGDYYVAYSSR